MQKDDLKKFKGQMFGRTPVEVIQQVFRCEKIKPKLSTTMIAVMCKIATGTVRKIIKDKRAFYLGVAKFALYSTCILFFRNGAYPDNLGRKKITTDREDRRIARDVCLIYVLSFYFTGC